MKQKIMPERISRTEEKALSTATSSGICFTILIMAFSVNPQPNPAEEASSVTVNLP